MALKKKGVFFTFIALFIIILLVALISTKDKYRYREKSNAMLVRTRTVNNFIVDFEKDLDRELFIGGYRALLSMNLYLKDTEQYITDFDSVFEEVLFSGSINGTSFNIMVEEGNQGADITSWLSRVNEEASKMNLEANLTVHELSVRHISPWEVEVTMVTEVYIRDTKGVASWDYNKTYAKGFSILGFEDPLYIIGTHDKVTNLINVTPSTEFIGAGNDTTVLNTHLLNSFYINSTKAPSFLMRFSGNLSPSPYGIESMVNFDDLDLQNILPLQRSVIDYIYFGNASTTDYCNITGTPPLPDWFRIDNSSISFYGIDALNPEEC